MQHLAGSVVGEQLELIREIGAGAMGIVYEAFDRGLGKSVTVKIIRPHLAQEAKTLQRFSQEVKLLARLQHPNIIRVNKSGLHNGSPL
jgi:serine/threonine protein kinase